MGLEVGIGQERARMAALVGALLIAQHIASTRDRIVTL